MCSHPSGATWALPDGTVEIDRVPVNNGGGDEAQARCAEALVFEGAVSNFPLSMEEHRASQAGRMMMQMVGAPSPNLNAP